MRRYILFLLVLASCLVIKAQTYRHDASILNQFTVMEMGAGALQPATYYDMFHREYMGEAYANGSKNYRMERFRDNTLKETRSSDSVKTALVKRAEVEDTYTVSRDPNLDVAWKLEQQKVETKMSQFYENIGKIMLLHPNPVEGRSIRNQWLDRYKCLSNDLNIIHKSRLTMGDRQSQYLKLYKRVMADNSQLLTDLYKFNSMRKAKKMEDATGKLKRHTSNATIAEGCMNTWSTKLMSGWQRGGKN